MRFGWRGTVLGAAALIAIAGCGGGDDSGPEAKETTGSAAETVDVTGAMRDLETRYGARLGVFAVDTDSGHEVSYRKDEKFALASTFKGIACGALLKQHPLHTGYWDTVAHFGQEDVVAASPISSQRVESGMTISELCHAAITASDNTAANQLLKQLGGPAAVTAFMRSIGDQVSRLDRWETDLNTNIPGDERDTTTPAALAADYRALVLGDVLGQPERDQLKAWLVANTTGAQRIRAGLPPGWTVGDKTGTPAYGGNNDVAIAWTELGGPIVISMLATKTEPDATTDNALLADATRLVVNSLNVHE